MKFWALKRGVGYFFSEKKGKKKGKKRGKSGSFKEGRDKREKEVERKRRRRS